MMNFKALLDQLKAARRALSGGLWDYGPGQDEHVKCKEVIEQCDKVIAQAEPMVAAALAIHGCTFVAEYQGLSRLFEVRRMSGEKGDTWAVR